MKLTDATAWFQEVSSCGGGLRKRSEKHYDVQEVAHWVTQATSALHSVFPPGHALAQRWDACLKDHVGKMSTSLAYEEYFNNLRGVFSAAEDLLKKGRLSSFVEGIRAETVSDLLDQADYLAEQKFVVAATVVAGGALETFLHFICAKNKLVVEGHGSIEKYKDAMAGARKAGNEVISLADEKQITAWGDLRNTAAHKPAEFARSVDAVKLMIDGVRQFISRYAG